MSMILNPDCHVRIIMNDTNIYIPSLPVSLSRLHFRDAQLVLPDLANSKHRIQAGLKKALPRAKSTTSVAAATAAPLEEPPQIRSVAEGFFGISIHLFFPIRLNTYRYAYISIKTFRMQNTVP